MIGYLPQNLYSLNSSYGSENMLKALLNKMRTYKVRAMADIVINHRVGTTQGNGGMYNRYDGIPIPWDEQAVTSCTGGKVSTCSMDTSGKLILFIPSGAAASCDFFNSSHSLIFVTLSFFWCVEIQAWSRVMGLSSRKELSLRIVSVLFVSLVEFVDNRVGIFSLVELVTRVWIFYLFMVIDFYLNHWHTYSAYNYN